MRTRSKRKSKRTCREAGSFFRHGPPKGAFCFCLPWRQAPVWFWQKPASWFNSTPRFLAAQRSAVSSRREEVAQRKPFKRVSSGRLRKQKGCGPFEIPGVPDLQCLTSRASSTYYGSTLFLVCTALLVCEMADDLPAEQQICDTLSAARHFCSAKILAGRAAMGDGALIAEYAVPAQRNFQRKFALRRVGSYKFVVPPTIESSKVREHARFVTLSVPGSSGCQRGRCPSVLEEVQRKPFRRVSSGQFLRGGSTRRFFAQLRSVGLN